MKTAILISGRGSNMKALVDAALAPDFPAEICMVLSNRPGAAGLQYAAEKGLRAEVLDHKAYDSRASFEQALDKLLRDAGVELICLAGFMRLLGSDFVMGWKDRMINIHPSLLPSYKGLNTHERALKDGVRFTGCTVHYVRPEMDDGPIIGQAVVPIFQDDDTETLASRVLEAEHQLYPAALKLLASGQLRVSGSRVRHEGRETEDAIFMNPMG